MASTNKLATFYPIWPVLDGKAVKFQWGQVRKNTSHTKAVARNSIQDVEDSVDDLNAEKQLAGFQLGEQEFSNRFRFLYDKDAAVANGNGTLTVQRNTGTEAVPVWVEMLNIRDSDGLIEVTGESGIRSKPGFYGSHLGNLDNVNEVGQFAGNSDGPYTNVATLRFDTDDGFYLHSDAQGNPIVSLNERKDRMFKASASGAAWTINHNLRALPVLAQAYDDGFLQIIPDMIDVSNPDVTYFYFSSSVTGHAIIKG